MDAEIQGLKKEISEVKELMTENNRMLKIVYRQARFSTIFNILKWVIIIGLSIGSFYFIQPYLEMMTKAYSAVPGLNNVSQDKDLIDQLRDTYLPR